MAGGPAIQFKLVRIRILKRTREFGAQKNDQPTEMQPEDEERQGGEAPVDRVIPGDADLGADVDSLKELITGPGKNSGQNPGFKTDPGIGHKNVQVTE